MVSGIFFPGSRSYRKTANFAGKLANLQVLRWLSEKTCSCVLCAHAVYIVSIVESASELAFSRILRGAICQHNKLAINRGWGEE